MNRLLFATAGVPLSCRESDSISGIRCVSGLGLDAMELEFVRGVHMGFKTADKVGDVARESGVVLTAHAPYFINLNSQDIGKYNASIERILQTARITHACGGWSIVFHAAYYMGDKPERTYERVREALKNINHALSSEGNKVWIRPEVTGKRTQWGDLEEVIKISQETENVLPCIDFAHMHARCGKYNTYEEFCKVLGRVEELLGRDALKNMHVHVSGIEFGAKGERRHMVLEESDLNYRELMRAFRDFNVCGVVVSESPNIEVDALLMKATLKTLASQ